VTDVMMDKTVAESADQEAVVRLDDLDQQLVGQLVDRGPLALAAADRRGRAAGPVDQDDHRVCGRGRDGRAPGLRQT
jgi:hypothetical protein